MDIVIDKFKVFFILMLFFQMSLKQFTDGGGFCCITFANSFDPDQANIARTLLSR